MGPKCQPKNIADNICVELHVNKEDLSPPLLVFLHMDCAKFTRPVSVSV